MVRMRNTCHGLSFVQGSPAPVMASSIIPASPMGAAAAKANTAVKILTFPGIFCPPLALQLMLTYSVQLVHLFVFSRGLPTGSSASSIHQGPFGQPPHEGKEAAGPKEPQKEAFATCPAIRHFAEFTEHPDP